MHIRNIVLINLFVFISIDILYGQYIKVEEQILFKSRIDNPVKFEALSQDDKYIFYAINRSFFPYHVNVNFSELKNLIPELRSRDFIVLPGRLKLFTLTVKEKEIGHSYKYTYTYKIGVPGKDADFKFPYLIPLGKNKSFEFVKYPLKEDTYFSDFFKLNQGDTVFNMRKGYIAAVPNMFHDADRISNRSSLEIIHKDGTIMIYENINPDSVFVKIGSSIYPGQALGIIDKNLILEVDLYMIQKDHILKRLNINYYLGANRLELFSENLMNFTANPPNEIITKEMTKRELKKYRINNE